jgi:predicted aspartyl protease
MNIRLQHDLLFASASLIYSGNRINCRNVLIDTGSACTVFSTDSVAAVGIRPEPDDIVRELRGIGGTEFVFIKTLDRLSLGNFQLNDFEAEIGAMDYGFDIDGIIGLDFLLRAKAKIDLEHLAIY